MNRIPNLSIITVVYNDTDNLLKTIKSIREQTFHDYEFIVIDGGSEKRTVDVINKNEDLINYWISEKDKGIYDAMNKGIRASQGQYLEFLNAGDEYVDENALQNIFAHNTKDYDVIYGEIELYNNSDMFLYNVPARPFTLGNLKHYGTGTLNHQAFFIKKTKAPYYSLKYRLKSELNWYIDILRQNKNISYKHVPIQIIKYKQGGRGYTEYWQNLFEWIKLVQLRFGLLQNLKNIKSYWNNIKYRYPFLNKFFHGLL